MFSSFTKSISDFVSENIAIDETIPAQNPQTLPRAAGKQQRPASANVSRNSSPGHVPRNPNNVLTNQNLPSAGRGRSQEPGNRANTNAGGASRRPYASVSSSRTTSRDPSPATGPRNEPMSAEQQADNGPWNTQEKLLIDHLGLNAKELEGLSKFELVQIAAVHAEMKHQEKGGIDLSAGPCIESMLLSQIVDIPGLAQSDLMHLSPKEIAKIASVNNQSVEAKEPPKQDLQKQKSAQKTAAALGPQANSSIKGSSGTVSNKSGLRGGMGEKQLPNVTPAKTSKIEDKSTLSFDSSNLFKKTNELSKSITGIDNPTAVLQGKMNNLISTGMENVQKVQSLNPVIPVTTEPKHAAPAKSVWDSLTKSEKSKLSTMGLDETAVNGLSKTEVEQILSVMMESENPNSTGSKNPSRETSRASSPTRGNNSRVDSTSRNPEVEKSLAEVSNQVSKFFGSAGDQSLHDDCSQTKKDNHVSLKKMESVDVLKAPPIQRVMSQEQQLAEQRRLDNERRLLEEQRMLEEEIRMEEERQKAEEEKRIAEQKRRKQMQERIESERKRLEQERIEEEERWRREEEERLRREEEERLRREEEERLRREEEERLRREEEERLRREEEERLRREEEERLRREEEERLRREEEERLRREEEERLRREEEERLRREEEERLRREEEERLRREEEERLRREEEERVRREEEERVRREEEERLRREEEERLRREEEERLRREEKERLRREEKERLRREEEERLRRQEVERLRFQEEEEERRRREEEERLRREDDERNRREEEERYYWEQQNRRRRDDADDDYRRRGAHDRYQRGDGDDRFRKDEERTRRNGKNCDKRSDSRSYDKQYDSRYDKDPYDDPFSNPSSNRNKDHPGSENRDDYQYLGNERTEYRDLSSRSQHQGQQRSGDTYQSSAPGDERSRMVQQYHEQEMRRNKYGDVDIYFSDEDMESDYSVEEAARGRQYQVTYNKNFPESRNGENSMPLQRNDFESKCSTPSRNVGTEKTMPGEQKTSEKNPENPKKRALPPGLTEADVAGLSAAELEMIMSVMARADEDEIVELTPEVAESKSSGNVHSGSNELRSRNDDVTVDHFTGTSSIMNQNRHETQKSGGELNRDGVKKEQLTNKKDSQIRHTLPSFPDDDSRDTFAEKGKTTNFGSRDLQDVQLSGYTSVQPAINQLDKSKTVSSIAGERDSFSSGGINTSSSDFVGSGVKGSTTVDYNNIALSPYENSSQVNIRADTEPSKRNIGNSGLDSISSSSADFYHGQKSFGENRHLSGSDFSTSDTSALGNFSAPQNNSLNKGLQKKENQQSLDREQRNSSADVIFSSHYQYTNSANKSDLANNHSYSLYQQQNNGNFPQRIINSNNNSADGSFSTYNTSAGLFKAEGTNSNFSEQNYNTNKVYATSAGENFNNTSESSGKIDHISFYDVNSAKNVGSASNQIYQNTILSGVNFDNINIPGQSSYNSSGIVTSNNSFYSNTDVSSHSSNSNGYKVDLQKSATSDKFATETSVNHANSSTENTNNVSSNLNFSSQGYGNYDLGYTDSKLSSNSGNFGKNYGQNSNENRTKFENIYEQPPPRVTSQPWNPNQHSKISSNQTGGNEADNPSQKQIEEESYYANLPYQQVVAPIAISDISDDQFDSYEKEQSFPYVDEPQNKLLPSNRNQHKSSQNLDLRSQYSQNLNINQQNKSTVNSEMENINAQLLLKRGEETAANFGKMFEKANSAISSFAEDFSKGMNYGLDPSGELMDPHKPPQR